MNTTTVNPKVIVEDCDVAALNFTFNSNFQEDSPQGNIIVTTRETHRLLVSEERRHDLYPNTTAAYRLGKSSYGGDFAPSDYCSAPPPNVLIISCKERPPTTNGERSTTPCGERLTNFGGGNIRVQDTFETVDDENQTRRDACTDDVTFNGHCHQPSGDTSSNSSQASQLPSDGRPCSSYHHSPCSQRTQQSCGSNDPTLSSQNTTPCSSNFDGRPNPCTPRFQTKHPHCGSTNPTMSSQNSSNPCTPHHQTRPRPPSCGNPSYCSTDPTMSSQNTSTSCSSNFDDRTCSSNFDHRTDSYSTDRSNRVCRSLRSSSRASSRSRASRPSSTSRPGSRVCRSSKDSPRPNSTTSDARSTQSEGGSSTQPSYSTQSGCFGGLMGRVCSKGLSGSAGNSRSQTPGNSRSRTPCSKLDSTGPASSTDTQGCSQRSCSTVSSVSSQGHQDKGNFSHDRT